MSFLPLVQTGSKGMDAGSDRSREKLVAVYSTHNDLQARMVQDLLRDGGIESLITGEMLPTLYPSNVGDLAKREIMVLESEAQEAGRIIAEAGWGDEE